MAIIVYKNGGKTICDPFSLDGMLAAGWSLTDGVSHVEEIQKGGDSLSPLVEDRRDSQEMTEDEIRQKAKEKGIKQWWTKKPENLLKELTGDNQS